MEEILKTYPSARTVSIRSTHGSVRAWGNGEELIMNVVLLQRQSTGWPNWEFLFYLSDFYHVDIFDTRNYIWKQCCKWKDPLYLGPTLFRMILEIFSDFYIWLSAFYLNRMWLTRWMVRLSFVMGKQAFLYCHFWILSSDLFHIFSMY